MRWLVFLLFTLLVALRGADTAAGFLNSLTPDQRMRLGLGSLTPAQAAELEAAVEAYARGPGAPAADDAKTKPGASPQSAPASAAVPVAPAARATVPRGAPKSTPRVNAPVAPAKSEEAGERFTARVIGPFRGWSGGTYFPLENGQVWRQVGTESNELPVRQNAEVEIYQSRNGYWRLSFEGAWITVRRLQ
jgi:hypothetical protein